MRRYKGYSCLCLCRSRGSMHELGTSSDKHHLASMFRGKFSKSRERLVSHLSYESRLFSPGSQCWGDSTLSSSLVVNSIGTAGVISRLTNSVPGIAAEKTGRLHNQSSSLRETLSLKPSGVGDWELIRAVGKANKVASWYLRTRTDSYEINV